MRITASAFDLNSVFRNFQHGNIKRTSAEVIDNYLLVLLLVETISQGGRGRLIDNTLHIESGNLTGIFSGFSLRVIEICRNSDDGISYLLTQLVFGISFELTKNHSGDFCRLVPFVSHLDLNITMLPLAQLIWQEFLVALNFGIRKPAANQALYRKNSIGRVSYSLALGSHTNITLTVLTHGDHLW